MYPEDAAARHLFLIHYYFKTYINNATSLFIAIFPLNLITQLILFNSNFPTPQQKKLYMHACFSMNISWTLTFVSCNIH